MSTANGSVFASGMGWLSVSALSVAALVFVAGLLGGFSPTNPAISLSSRELAIVLASVSVSVIAALFTCLLLVAQT